MMRDTVRSLFLGAAILAASNAYPDEWSGSEFFDNANHYPLGPWSTALNTYQAITGQYWAVEPGFGVPDVVANSTLGVNTWSMDRTVAKAFYMDHNDAGALGNVGFRAVFVPDSTSGISPNFNVMVSDGRDRNSSNWLCHFSFFQSLFTVSSSIHGGGGIAYLGGNGGGAGAFPSTNGDGAYFLPANIPVNTPVTCDIRVIDPGAATTCSSVNVTAGNATFAVNSTAGMYAGQTVYECFSGPSPTIGVSSVSFGAGSATAITLSSAVSVQKGKRVYITGTAGGLYDGIWNVAADTVNSADVLIDAPWKGSAGAGGTLFVFFANDGAYVVSNVVDATHFIAPALLSTQTATEAAGVATRKGQLQVVYAGLVYQLQEEAFAIVISSAGGMGNISHCWWEVYPQPAMPHGTLDPQFIEMWANSPTAVTIAGAGNAQEGTNRTATFAISRTGDITKPLTVQFSPESGAGDAAANRYTLSPSASVTIPAGSLSATVTVIPANDSALLGSQSVTLDLLADPAYTISDAGTASVTLLDTPGNSWKIAQFGSIAAAQSSIADDNAAPAGDGIANLTKYALGLTALKPAPGPVTSVGWSYINGTKHLTLSIVRPSPPPPDLIYNFETNTDPASGAWLPAVISPGYPISKGPGAETVVAQDPQPAESETQSALRLRVSRALAR